MRKDMTSKLLMAGLVAFGATQAASAGSAKSFSLLTISDLMIKKDTGGAFVDGTDIQVQALQNQSSNDVALNGFDPAPFTASDPNAPQQVLGTDPGNGFVDYNTPDTFVRANTDGSGDLLDPSNPANARTVAEADVLPVNDAESDSNIGLSSTLLRFTGQGDINADISFSADWEKKAILDLANLAFPSQAFVNTEFDIELFDITDGDTKFNISTLNSSRADGAQLINDSFTANIFNPSRTNTGSSDFWGTFDIEDGHEYELTIVHRAEADAYAIPSPSAAVFGLAGLAGLGMRRRRSSK